MIDALEPHLPILVVLAPLFGAFFIAFFRSGIAGWILASVATWTAAALAVWMLFKVATTGVTLSYVMGAWSAPWGIEYRVDILNAFVVAFVSLIGAVVLAFAGRSVAREVSRDRRIWFYAMYLLCLAGLNGIAVSGDAFNIFVFLEVSSLSTYVLIAIGRNRRGLLAAYQYLIVGTIGATLYVIGVGLLYVVTGTLNLADMATQLADASQLYSRPVLAALAFLTVGVGLKLALFPMHAWLPNAYAYAPSAAAAFLAGTATKVAIYLLIRIFYTLYGGSIGIDAAPVLELLLALSIAAILLPSITAIFEANAKRMLAYSSVAQVGYITFGVSLANIDGLTGGVAHMFNHAITKAALFLALGAVAYRLGSTRIEDLAGLGRKMPITMACFALAGFSLIGVPGTAGFISKWYLALGALETGAWVLLFWIVASSVITVIYVGRVIETAFFREAPETASNDARDPPLSMLAPLLLLTGATIYFGVDTRASVELAARAAEALIGGLR